MSDYFKQYITYFSIQEYHSSKYDKHNLVMMTLNIRSYNKNIEYVLLLIEMFKIKTDIIIFTETCKYPYKF